MASRLRLPHNLFQLATSSDHAELHVAVLQVFGAASERLETTLTRQAVRAALVDVGWLDPVSDEDLAARLQQFERWGLVDIVQDHSLAYRSAADFERNNLQYSLTKHGEAALAGIEKAWEVLNTAGALQTSVLDAIADRLDDLHRRLNEPGAGDRAVYTALFELEGHLEALKGNVAQFNNRLQQLLAPQRLSLDAFIDVKTATIAYLEEFCANLPVRAARIREALARVETDGVESMHRRALGGAELPPSLGEDHRDHWLEHRSQRWEGLRAWFSGEEPRVRLLGDIARRAINTLLLVLERIDGERRRSASAVQDFRVLARWFAATDTEAESHLLADAAFGLGSARHAHLAVPDPELADAHQSWAEASVKVDPVLYTAGRSSTAGRAGKVRDIAELRRARRKAAQEERAQLREAWSLLHTGGQIRLSDFGSLDADRFSRLLELLGAAWQTEPGPGGVRRAHSADGGTVIELVPARGECVLKVAHGTLTGPDCSVTIAPARRS
jgi:uncharacterized protein (TIGR02677 family)